MLKFNLEDVGGEKFGNIRLTFLHWRKSRNNALLLPFRLLLIGGVYISLRILKEFISENVY